MLLGYLEIGGGLCDMAAFTELVTSYVSGRLVDFLVPKPIKRRKCANEGCEGLISSRRDALYCSRKCNNKVKYLRWKAARLTNRSPNPEEYQKALKELA